MKFFKSKSPGDIVGSALAAVSLNLFLIIYVFGDTKGLVREYQLTYRTKVLPDDPRPWYRVPHLVQLNLLLLIPLMSSCAIGYDGHSLPRSLFLT